MPLRQLLQRLVQRQRAVAQALEQQQGPDDGHVGEEVQASVSPAGRGGVRTRIQTQWK